MSDAIRVEGLRFAYPAPARNVPSDFVIDGITLSVRSGEWLTVMGPNDAGKSTLCLLLAGLAPHLTGGRLEGQVVVSGRETRTNPPPALAGTVGLVLQEPEAQLFNPTVEREIAWGLENLGLSLPDMRPRVDEMLSLFRLEAERERSPAELSGGEKKRLALASVMAMRPSILILDEPLGGLDPAGRVEVLSALASLRHRHGDGPVTIVMTESEPEPVVAFSDRLVVLNRGRIALEGLPADLFRRVHEMAAFGVSVPQLVRLAATLNETLDTSYGFATLDEARAELAVHLG
jgi:energy-coupling factor transporter ATP-binding protein EcfA2